MDYVVRFNAAMLEVHDLNKFVALSIMKKGLQSSKFIFSLNKKSSKTYSKLLARAQKYTLVEEGATSRCQAEGRLVPKKKKI